MTMKNVLWNGRISSELEFENESKGRRTETANRVEREKGGFGRVWLNELGRVCTYVLRRLCCSMTGQVMINHK
jgi:hypothetical protein